MQRFSQTKPHGSSAAPAIGRRGLPWGTSMAARTIVTSHPDVACDVCGRRLLRGEQPDVFVGGGQRRMVCELCTSRATHEGWRRETEAHTAKSRSKHPQRGRSLLGRLRQRREPAPPVRAPGVDVDPSAPESETAAGAEWPQIGAEWAEVEEEWTEPQQSWNGVEPAADEPAAAESPAAHYPTDPSVQRALEVFNAGEHPRRLAGVARSLGAPSVRATRTAEAKVAIVVAWELCWYRYEIDVAGGPPHAQLTAEGMELEELPGEDRIANAVADERGALSLLS